MDEGGRKSLINKLDSKDYSKTESRSRQLWYKVKQIYTGSMLIKFLIVLIISHKWCYFGLESANSNNSDWNWLSPYYAKQCSKHFTNINTFHPYHYPVERLRHREFKYKVTILVSYGSTI